MWIVQLNGNINTPLADFELSVVRETNEHGINSWGCGSEDKIILFGTGIGKNTLYSRTKTSIKFALEVAEKLCKALNENLV